MIQRRLGLILLLFVAYAQGLFAQQDTSVAALLVPFTTYKSVAGAGGSLWSAELWVHNTSDQGFVALVDPFAICLFSIGCGNGIEAGFIGKPEVARMGSGGAAIVYVPRSIAEQVHFSGLVFEKTRNSQPAGFSVPIAREDQFVSDLTLMGLPVTPLNRITLRLFGIHNEEGDVQATFLDDTGHLITKRTFRVLRDSSYDVLPSPPKYILVPSSMVLFDVVSAVPELLTRSSFSVELESETAGFHFWGFATVTDNVTDAVTVIESR